MSADFVGLFATLWQEQQPKCTIHNTNDLKSAKKNEQTNSLDCTHDHVSPILAGTRKSSGGACFREPILGSYALQPHQPY